MAQKGEKGGSVNIVPILDQLLHIHTSRVLKAFPREVRSFLSLGIFLTLASFLLQLLFVLNTRQAACSDNTTPEE